MPDGKVVREERRRAPLYLAKAREFAAEARSAVDATRYDAALLTAVHAAISAADAVAVALVGLRSADPDHRRAVDLLRDAARGSSEIDAHARQLRSLLSRKNVVEYESRRATAAEASDGVRRAERFLDWSSEVVARAPRG